MMKLKLRRLLAILLAVMFVLGTLTACKGDDSETTKAPNNDKTQEQNNDDKTTEAEPKELPVITFHVPLFGVATDEAKVEEKLNELLAKNGIEAKMDMVFVSAYQDKLSMSITAREELDLLFTCNSSWALSYVDSARKGAWLELDALLEQYGQGIIESYPENIIEGAKVDGKLYAIPNYQNSVIQYNFAVPTELVDKYNLDVDGFDEVKDIEPFLQAIKDNEPEMIPYRYTEHILFSSFYEDGWCAIPGTSNYIWCDSDYKVGFGEEVRKEFAQLMLDWYEKGYLRSDINSATDDNADMLAGKYAVIDNSDLKPGCDANYKQTYGKDFVFLPIMEAVQQPTGAMSAMTAISATTEHPEICMQIINLIDTDAEFYNTICYGVEGVHFTLNDNKTITQLEASKDYAPGADWSFGCQYNAYPTQDMEPDTYVKMKEYNDTANASLLAGFVYDGSNTERERANIATVMGEYAALFKGCVSRDEFDAQWDRMISLLGEAGLQKVIDDAQSQIDAWLAAK